MSLPCVSVIIPTLNESETIALCVRSASAAGASEIIIADGGSEDDTVENARRAGATHVVVSNPGRGTQLHAGANVASCDWLLFLHADNQLGPDCLNQVAETGDDESGDIVWGAFEQNIAAKGRLYRWLERGNASRVHWRGIPFGDQAMFVRTEIYQRVGGFATIPLMEDVDLAKRLKRIESPVLLPGPVVVNARRWQRRGVVLQTARNWSIQLAYRMGVSPERLKRWYQ